MKEIEPILYVDVQAEKTGDYCPVCGRERYMPGLTCLYCERSKP